MTEADTRLEGLIRRFVSGYLRPLLGLLADEGVGPDEQRERADRLVRALLEAEAAENLRENGRRIVVKIADGESPPRVTFNADFVRDVDDGEALGLLEEPVAEILELSPFRVGLIFQLEDEESRSTLLHRARRSGRSVVGPAEIPSVVEMRLRRFVDCLERVGDVYDAGLDFQLDFAGGVESIVDADVSEWPSWSEAGGAAFLQSVLLQLEETFQGTGDRPHSGQVAEICWESLDLSAQSALRRAGELLRGERDEGNRLEVHLRRFSAVFSDDGGLPEWAREWPELTDVAEAWSSLFRTEQQMLSWAAVRRETPGLSVFEPPETTLHLDEPSSLPWKIPLVCWSIRERRALCDLLAGHRKSIRSELPAREEIRLEVAHEPGGPQLRTDGNAPNFVLRTGDPDAAAQPARTRRLERAVEACCSELYRQFETLDRERRQDTLGRLRDAYDAYFPRGSAVWERRFQSWNSLPSERAFGLLAFEVQRVLGAHILLDPFGAVGFDEGGRTLPDRPVVVFVTAFAEQRATSEFRVPLALLRSQATGLSLQLRAVEVPDDDRDACRWLADEALPVGAVAELPPEKLLATVENDAVMLQVERHGNR